MAVGRCPETGADLASQSTISRYGNAPSRWDAGRLCRALVDQFTARVTPSHRDIFDIDDTLNAAHGGQQLVFWNAHHVVSKTPSGVEVRTVIKHLTTRILETWRTANIVWRGDSHYARVPSSIRSACAC